MRPQLKKQCSQNNIIKEKYQEILFDIRAKGYIVRHKKLPKDIAGFFNSDTWKIEIDSSLRETLEGCYCLCHEFSHLQQIRYNEFMIFHKLSNKEEFTEEKFREVVAAEVDAARRAQKMLKQYNIYYTPEELTKKGLKDYKIFWRKYYFPGN